MEFICDSMFGKLARMLRMLGYRTQYIRDNNRVILSDPAFLQGRTVITTDKKRIFHGGEKFILTELEPAAQLKLLRGRFNLTADCAFTVCMECNTLLAPAEKNLIKNKLPEMVYRNFTSFTMCPSCGRAYWEGTHYLAIRDKIRKAGY